MHWHRKYSALGAVHPRVRDRKTTKNQWVRIIGTAAQKGAIISFVVEGLHPLDVGTLLDVHGVAVRTGHHCAQPALRHFGLPGTTRASFGLYNNKGEVDAFVEALQAVIKTLR